MMIRMTRVALFGRYLGAAAIGAVAGVIVGPHLPVPLFADESVARHLSELGVILLMFSLGLELSLAKLIQVAPTAGVVAVIECSLQLWAGYAVGRAMGGTSVEALFVGAMVAISSTTIIAKAFDRLKNKLLHAPISALKEEPQQHAPAHTLLDAMRKLFRLQD